MEVLSGKQIAWAIAHVEVSSGDWVGARAPIQKSPNQSRGSDLRT
jgi:hypothetical protein